MKTEVIMKRELFGYEICQKSKSEFFSATDLVKAGNSWRLKNNLDLFSLSVWMQKKNTKEFIAFLSEEYGQVKINAKAKNQHTWVHPFLFIKIALSINPKLEIKVYEWLYDCLLRYRNHSGDSYKKMAGSIFLNIKNKSEYKPFLIGVAKLIKSKVGVSDWNSANEKQLLLRDKIHENMSLLSDVVPDLYQAIDISIDKAKKDFNN